MVHSPVTGLDISGSQRSRCVPRPCVVPSDSMSLSSYSQEFGTPSCLVVSRPPVTPRTSTRPKFVYLVPSYFLPYSIFHVPSFPSRLHFNPFLKPQSNAPPTLLDSSTGNLKTTASITTITVLLILYWFLFYFLP